MMHIITNRKIWFSVSLAILVVGLGSLFVQGLNLGIDFTGGTIFHIRIGEDFHVEEVREIFFDEGIDDVLIQEATDEEGASNEVVVRTVAMDEAERNQIISAFRDRWPDIGEEDILRTDTVGSTIGQELRSQAFWALLVATVAIIGYISYRFEYRFALAGVAAIIHDAFIVLTVFSLLQVEINEPFIAAILLIVGYSINDTIVVFDRIREMLTLDKDMSIKDLVQVSVRKTIRRSLNTSITTTLVLISLYIFTGVTLRPFILALLLGVIVGTYSSIFIAANCWSLLAQKFKGHVYQYRRSSA